MKTILLTAAAILTLTFSSKADDNKVAKSNRTEINNALFVPMFIGSPDEQAPVELASLLANPSPVAAAPMFAGNPNEEAPVELKNILAYAVKVPVAPLAVGNPDDEAPLELSNMPAYAVN